MKQLRRVWKTPVFWLILFSLAYFILRLTRLTYLPIFTDEAIYIRWAQIGGNDASWRFISMTDGKQPLFTWLMMVSLRIFSDPLFAGRFVSVIAGFFSMIGMYFLGKTVFKSRAVGVMASFVYLISPFCLMYDRMALYDSLVATFSIWNLTLAILLVRKLRLDVALILGLTVGVGMLNKTSAFLTLYMMPTTLLLFDWNKKKRTHRLLMWLGLVLVVTVLSQMVYAILRLSPYFYIISQKDALFVYPFSEWLQHPFEFLYGNFRGMFNWLITYLSWPVFIASLLAITVGKKNFLEKTLLLLWWIMPFTALALFGKVLYPRFFLFMVMPLILLASYTIVVVSRRFTRPLYYVLFALVMFLPNIRLSYVILTDITHAKLAKGDIGQYVNDWPSGWGTQEAVDFFKKEASKGPIAVYTEGTFGLFPYALEIYLHTYPSIIIEGLWPFPDTLPDGIRKTALRMPTYLVMYQTEKVPNWPLDLIAEYQKGSNPDRHMRLYQISITPKK